MTNVTTKQLEATKETIWKVYNFAVDIIGHITEKYVRYYPAVMR